MSKQIKDWTPAEWESWIKKTAVTDAAIKQRQRHKKPTKETSELDHARKKKVWGLAEWGLWGTQRTCERAVAAVDAFAQHKQAKVIADKRHARIAGTERYKMIAECRKNPAPKPVMPFAFKPYAEAMEAMVCDDPHCDHDHE
jgi:hypothetical protein